MTRDAEYAEFCYNYIRNLFLAIRNMNYLDEIDAVWNEEWQERHDGFAGKGEISTVGVPMALDIHERRGPTKFKTTYQNAEQTMVHQMNRITSVF